MQIVHIFNGWRGWEWCCETRRYETDESDELYEEKIAGWDGVVCCPCDFCFVAKTRLPGGVCKYPLLFPCNGGVAMIEWHVFPHDE